MKLTPYIDFWHDQYGHKRPVFWLINNEGDAIIEINGPARVSIASGILKRLGIKEGDVRDWSDEELHLFRLLQDVKSIRIKWFMQAKTLQEFKECLVLRRVWLE